MTARYALLQAQFNLGYASIFSFAGVFLLSRGLSDGEVGVALTLAAALALVGQPFLAAFADRQRRIPLKAFLAGFLVLAALWSLVLTFVPLAAGPTIVLYGLLAAGHLFQNPVLTSMGMEHIHRGTPLNFSLARGIGSAAFAALSFALGYAVQAWGGAVIPLATLVLALGGIVLALTFPRPAAAQHEALAPVPAADFRRFARENRRFLALCGALALVLFSQVVINSYAIQIVRHLGGTEADMGIGTAWAGILELPAMALFPWLLKKRTKAGFWLGIASVAFTLKALLTWWAPGVAGYWAAQTLQFAGFAWFVPASVYYVQQTVAEADKVKGQTWMGMALGLSSLVGNAAGGLLLSSAGGVPLMLAVGTGVSAVGTVLVYLTMRVPGVRLRAS